VWQDDRGRGYTAYLLAKDLPGDVDHYSLALEISGDMTVYPNFPVGTEFTSSLNVNETTQLRQYTYDVTPAECISASGLTELTSFDFTFTNDDVFVDHIAQLRSASITMGEVGYAPCGQDGSSFYSWNFASDFVNVLGSLGGPAATGSMGTLKS